MIERGLFSSESVADGHPTKFATKSQTRSSMSVFVKTRRAALPSRRRSRIISLQCSAR